MKKTLSIALMLLMIITTSCAAQNANTLRQANRTHTIDKRINGGIVAVGDGSTLVFKKGGKITNATITGRNIKIVPNGNDVAFENCDFSRATIVNSSLQATNLGLVPNMTSKPHSYTFKGMRINTRKRIGTDNTQAWKQLTQLLSNSNGVKVSFNGSFYSGEKTVFVYIRDANNLELSDGTMIMGLRLVNCNNVNVHDMRFVGFEEVHDFPPIYYNAPKKVNGINYTTSNSYKASVDGLVPCGLADDAIKFDIDNDNKKSENISVARCHFEMRQDGLSISRHCEKQIIRNVTCIDCTASHILYQPIGFCVVNMRLENMTADYCLQGVDISSCSNEITVDNCRFTRCALGPKQAKREGTNYSTYNKVISNCYFGITDDFFMIDAAQYIFLVAEGPKNDVVRIKNSTFDIKKNRQLTAAANRTNKVILENVNINIDVNLHAKSESQWSMADMFTIFGKTNHNPQYEFNNVNINLSKGTTIAEMFFPHGGGSQMSIKASKLNVKGYGSVDTYFKNVKNVDLNSCALDISSKRIAKEVTTMDINNCIIANTKCLWLSENANATLRLKNNNIKSEKVVDFKTTPKLIDIQGNNIEMTGGEAFAGADSKASLSSCNFKVAGNTFTRKTSSAKVLPSNSKSSKLLNNNVVK